MMSTRQVETITAGHDHCRDKTGDQIGSNLPVVRALVPNQQNLADVQPWYVTRPAAAPQQ